MLLQSKLDCFYPWSSKTFQVGLVFSSNANNLGATLSVADHKVLWVLMAFYQALG
jgi:hypothetical protein